MNEFDRARRRYHLRRLREETRRIQFDAWYVFRFIEEVTR